MGNRRIFVAGHGGLVGSAIVRALLKSGADNLIVRRQNELDLRDQRAVHEFFRNERPDCVFLAAAKVGGILANNTLRWDFLYDNLLIEANVLGAALEGDVKRLVFLGSSCIYPKMAQQPIRESELLTGPLEPTNEPYAIAKIAGVELVDAANRQHGRTWVSLMPTNLYGPGDNFDLQSSHVLPAMIRKFHEAQARLRMGELASVELWGTGSALREFLHVDDLAAAALHMLASDATGLFNVGSGSDLTIRALAELVASVIGYVGPVTWDASKPDGTPRKLLDSSRIRATGWAPTIDLHAGITDTYQWYLTAVDRH